MASSSSLQRRFAMVGAALVVPLFAVTWLLLGQMNLAIDFARQEVLGIQHLRPLQEALSAAADVRFARVRNQSDSSAEQRIDKALQMLDKSADEVSEVLRAQAQLRGLKSAWSAARSSATPESQAALVAGLRALIARLGDTSNLILDPDLDTYYVMDAMLIKIPDSVDLLGQIHDYANAIQNRGSITPEEVTQLVVWSGLLRSDRDGILYDSKVAFENNSAKDLPRDVQNAIDHYSAATDDLLEYINAKINTGKLTAGSAALKEKISDAISASDKMYTQASSNLEKMLNRRASELATRKWLVLFGVLVIELLALAWALRSLQEILHGLGGEPEYARSVVQSVAVGDLSGSVMVSGEPSSLLGSLAHMQNTLRQLITRVREESEHLMTHTDGLLKVAQNVVATSHQQTAATETMSTAIHESMASVHEVAQNAELAQSVSNESNQIALAGEKAVQAVAEEMRALSSFVGESAHAIEDLGKRSDQIQSIVQTIRGIADQTNLLALNAAIEAARAGDQGRGFAVVADEVRQLASRTSISTREIAEMVEAIQGGTATVVTNMDSLARRADSSVQRFDAVIEQIGKIRDATHSARAATHSISVALGQQESANGMLNKRVEEVARLAQENSRSVETTAMTVTKLRQLADQLQKEIAHFKL